MRPTLLNPLFAPVTSLPGVGPKQDKLLRYLLSAMRRRGWSICCCTCRPA